MGILIVVEAHNPEKPIFKIRVASMLQYLEAQKIAFSQSGDGVAPGVVRGTNENELIAEASACRANSASDPQEPVLICTCSPNPVGKRDYHFDTSSSQKAQHPVQV